MIEVIQSRIIQITRILDSDLFMPEARRQSLIEELRELLAKRDRYNENITLGVEARSKQKIF
jgi:RNase P/RNase MRP subunit p30